MAFDAHSNLGYSTVATAPSPAGSGTTLTVAAGQGALFPAAPFNCTVWPANALSLSSNAEIIRVTSKGTGDNWTILRTQEGTSARSILVGDQIANTITVKAITDVETVATPTTLTVATTNSSAIAAHTHAITSSSNPGAAASLLASDANGGLQLVTGGFSVAPVANQILTIKTATATNTALVVQTSDDNSTKNLQEWKQSSGANRSAIDGLGNWGINASINLSYAMSLNANSVHNAATSGAQYALFINNSAAPGSASNATYRCLFAQSASNSTNVSSATLEAFSGQARFTGTGGLGTLSGGNFIADTASSGTVSNAFGARAQIQPEAGTITNAYGFRILDTYNGGTGTIGTFYGFHVGNLVNGLTITNAYGLYVSAVTGASTLNYSIYTNAAANGARFGHQLSLVGSTDVQQLLVTGFTTQVVATSLVQFTRNDATAGISAMLGLTALGSGANGDGGSILLNGKSSTTAAQAMGLDQWLWVNATHASRTARRVFNVYDTAVREGFRIEASGSAPMMGFLGANAVIRQVGDIIAGLGNFGLFTTPLLPYGAMYANDISVTVTIGAPDTYVEVGSGMTGGVCSSDFTFQNSKELKCNTAGTYRISYNMSVSPASGANVHIEGGVMVNTTGFIQFANATHLANSNDEQSVGGSNTLALAVNDVVKLCVKEETGTINVIVTHANLSLEKVSA